MSRIRTALIAASAAAVVGVGATTVPGLAAGGSSTSSGSAATPSTATAAPSSSKSQTRSGRADRRDELDQALAKRLGITVEKLQQAEDQARSDVFVAHLDQMVADGRIAKADADALRAAAGAGTLDKAMKTLARTHLQKELADHVKSGEITQGQADAILKRFDQGDGRFGFGMMGGPGGHRGMGGMGGMRGMGDGDGDHGFGGPPPVGGASNGGAALPIPAAGPQA